MTRQTVIGIFREGIDAQTAVQKLESTSHINHNRIDIAKPGSATATQAARATDNNPDGVSNFFSSLFGKSDEADKHTQAARRSWVVTVHADSEQEARQAADVMDACGAIDVDETNMQSDPQARSATPPPQGATQDITGNADRTIPIVEERMNVGKREVETGGIRMRSRIIERPVEENLRLREEHVHVERRPVNRPATEQDFQNFKEGEATITERKEVPDVSKEARVIEEVRIGKHTEERNQTIRGTERKTDVDVNQMNSQTDPSTRRQGTDPDTSPNR